jgi:hypothetical protein
MPDRAMHTHATANTDRDSGLGTGLLVGIFLVLAVLAIAALILFGFARTAVA